MALHVKDNKTDALVRELAQLRGIGITEAIRQAVKETLASDRQKAKEQIDDLKRRIQPIIDEIASYPKTDFIADKNFFDDIYEEPHGDFSKTDVNDGHPPAQR